MLFSPLQKLSEKPFGDFLEASFARIHGDMSANLCCGCQEILQKSIFSS